MPHWNVNSFHIGVDNHLLYQIWENKNLCGTYKPFRLFRRQKYFGHFCTLSVVNHQHLLTNSIAYSLHNAPFIHSSIHSYHRTTFLPTCWHILLLKTKTLARNSSSPTLSVCILKRETISLQVQTDSRPNLEDFKIFTIQHEAFKKKETCSLFPTKQTSHSHKGLSWNPGWWLQPPNFYRCLANWIISTCKGETSKKITTFVNAYFTQFHPNAAEGHSSSSLPGRRPAPNLRNHIRGKGCKSPPEPCNTQRQHAWEHDIVTMKYWLVQNTEPSNGLL